MVRSAHIPRDRTECPIPDIEQALSTDVSAASVVLFVDDDEDVLKAAALLLPRHGLRMLAARSPSEASSVLASASIDVVLLDLNFTRGASTGEEGLRFLADLVADDPERVVVVVTAHSGVATAVAAMRGGATDFVMKPWSNARLVATLQDAAALARSRATRPPSAGDARVDDGARAMLGDSPAIRRVTDLLRRAASLPSPVLIYGAAGTGKTLAARRLHAMSDAGRLLELDLASADADAIDAAFAQADVTTLLLEDLDRLAPALQTHLARALPRSNARMIATSRAGRDELRARLKSELLYALNTIEVVMPPLSERAEDAAILAEHWARVFAARYGRPLRSLSDAARRGVVDHPWLDAARGLRLAVERSVALGEGSAPFELADLAPATAGAEAAPAAPDLDLGRSERSLVEAALKRRGFNVSLAAQDLGLTRAALYRRMAKHGL